MIKKYTAILFILLANIILLAHAVTPHHYHQGKVCIESSHCHASDDTHSHDKTETEHEHDNNSTPEYCALKQVVLVLPNQSKQKHEYPDCTDNHIPQIGYHAVLLNTNLSTFTPSKLSNLHSCFSLSSYKYTISSGIGLRAPPIV